ncbi:AAA family ATPase [Empedobacter falsenii]
MKKYYLKKASKQDVTKTVVVNNPAIYDFFEINTLETRNDEVFIKVNYGTNPTTHDVRIVLKQDKRIFFDRNNLEIEDIICYQKNDDESYTISFIKPTDERYTYLSSKLNNNFLITDSIIDIKPDTITETNYPLNQILYGPPGTGKTYTTIKKSLEILGLETGDPTENVEIFRSQLNHRIFFATMHPSYSYEDFVQGMKPETNEAGQLVFKQKDGVFKKVADLAKDLVLDDGEETNINTLNNIEVLKIAFFLSKFNDKPTYLANNYLGDKSNSVVFANLSKKININPNSLKNLRDKFDYLCSKSRKGWTPRNSIEKLDNKPLWPFQDVYEELKDKSFEEMKVIVDDLLNTSNKEVQDINKLNNDHYVLILDEINRANISKVFGELITLIEEDKRIGGENEMSLLLSSGEEFSVPSNLYIIGTMNTADKSIALVDLALRRRFEFEAMYPDSDIILEFGKKEIEEKKIFLDAINKQLIEVKGVDFQIGHAYFLKENTLSDVINKNILPLLVEYFRNDLQKVKNFMDKIGYGIDDNHLKTKGLLKYGN